MTTAVVGAGPAGLAAAWHLERAGHDVIVLDAAPQVGGGARSRTVAGVCVDLGCHRFDPSMPTDVRREIESLVELQSRPGNDRVRIGDRWFSLPLTSPRLRRGLPWPIAARVELDRLRRSVRRGDADADRYTDVVRAAVGPALASRFHEPYGHKVWETAPEQLAGRLAQPLLASTDRPPAFLYPARGFGSLVEAMAARVSDIRLGTRVDSIDAVRGGVRIGLADGRSVRADHVISTMAVGKTAAMVGVVRPSQVHTAHRGVVLVYLLIRRRPYTAVDAYHLPGRHVLPIRVSEPLNLRSDPGDPDDRTVLCAEIPCSVGDEVWTAADDDLGHRVADDLVRCGLPEPRHVAVETVRLPASYPVLTPASVEATATAEAALERVPRVTVIGRQDRSPHDAAHRPFEMGFAAAAHLLRASAAAG